MLFECPTRFSSLGIPPPLRYLSISFDGSVRNKRGGASFVIKGSDLGIVTTRESFLFELTISVVELRGAWAGIIYAQRILQVDRLIIEGNSATVISWIREAMKSTSLHPLIHDIALLLQDCSDMMVRHVYREVNSVVD